ncbi:MAG: ATP-grasp domain-containing protein [Chloroflexi bacterium]|nr:ATP-grasp domain-containing protein [Chloroflexota bacterium]
MVKKLLVANRGEIAARLFRACRLLGVRSVAIYSEADAQAPWPRLADERYPLKGVAAADTYLNQSAILAIARQAGAEAIHPGYGFLSENADFAQACVDAGIIFVGPSAAAMRALGSKASARELAQAAGVPVIPGVNGAGMSDEGLLAAAHQIGFPVLIKASAGGGGKGMRVVEAENEFLDAVQAARRESISAFGSDHLILEKYFTQVRHIEVQVLGDLYGHLIHLYERECSVQRRHQKIIEETPAPHVPVEVREGICAAAVSLAQEVGYASAGTVEFILTPENQFYLLEMNTRLQVEHPVTEWVTGVDIAAWQIRIASGEPLTLQQADIRQRGHALESRVYAEDPAHNFMPSTGTITHYARPQGPNIRVDDGIETGSVVSPYYDPMLAKIITWGADRADAIAQMRHALHETAVLGITTNIPYLLAILAHPAFQSGQTHTGFLGQHFPTWQAPTPATIIPCWAIAVAELLVGKSGPTNRSQSTTNGPLAIADPWNQTTGWRNVLK